MPQASAEKCWIVQSMAMPQACLAVVHAGPEGAKDMHLLRVLRMLLPLVAPPAAVHAAAAGDESELLDACRGLLAAAAVHRASGFERAAAGE